MKNDLANTYFEAYTEIIMKKNILIPSLVERTLMGPAGICVPMS